MGIFSRLLLTGGLVIMTGPLCFMAHAQPGYVDLEAEQAAARAAGKDPSSVPADPYGAPQPAQAYPATSYGVSTAPAAVPVTSTAPVQTSGSGVAPSGMGSLVLQVQQLQQEIMRLNGKVEEQAHEIRMLKEQSKQRYMDIDRRLGGGSGTAEGTTLASGSLDSAPVAVAASGSGAGTAVEQPGESEAYRAAYALVQGKQFDQAIPAFQQFLRKYPDGRYAPNAQYWLGELYLVLNPPDLESSRQAFALLVSEYPDHAKTPDAFFKLGKVQFLKGNREKAREYFDLVIRQYGSSNSSAAKLSREFIAEHY